jgi:hypothetical protein
MKNLFLGLVIILLVGFGGFFYRNAVEHSPRPISCPVETFTCPDGTKLSHTGLSCNFPTCPPPNVSIADLGIAFALPANVSSVTPNDSSIEAAYETPTVSSTEIGSVLVRKYPISASSTALETIQQSAIGGASGLPISPTSFTSTELGSHHFTVVAIERFEGVVTTAYYLARNTDVLRFDAIDRGVDWTNPSLDIASLPAHAALLKMLATLQGQ